LLAQPEVVLAEGDRRVDQARPLVGGDEVGEQDRVAPGAVVGDVVEGWLVRGTCDRLAREVGENLDVLPEHVLDPVAGEHEDLVSARLSDLLVAAEDLDPDVLDLGARGNGRVGDQRPGGRCPDEQLIARL
jgi:hypothetical protein